MSDTGNGETGARRIPGADELANANPKINPDQLDKIGTLLEHLRREGIARPGYRIASPRGRRSLVRHQRNRRERS